jgi:hypothetical protein
VNVLARGLLQSGGAVVKVDPSYLDGVSMPVSSSSSDICGRDSR